MSRSTLRVDEMFRIIRENLAVLNTTPSNQIEIRTNSENAIKYALDVIACVTGVK